MSDKCRWKHQGYDHSFKEQDYRIFFNRIAAQRFNLSLGGYFLTTGDKICKHFTIYERKIVALIELISSFH